MEVHAFSKCISLWLKFELVYFDFTVQHISHYAAGTSRNIFVFIEINVSINVRVAFTSFVNIIFFFYMYMKIDYFRMEFCKFNINKNFDFKIWIRVYI